MNSDKIDQTMNITIDAQYHRISQKQHYNTSYTPLETSEGDMGYGSNRLATVNKVQ